MIALVFVLTIGLIPYSYTQDCDCLDFDISQCERSDFTVTDEKGNQLGACNSNDYNKGQLFTYVKEPADKQSCKHKVCCEANTARWRNLCINYSLCSGKLKIQSFLKRYPYSQPAEGRLRPKVIIRG